MKGRMVMRLENKVALITGAARGIGYETARKFIDEGATVIIADINGEAVKTSAAELSKSGRAEGVILDVTNFASVHQTVDRLIQSYEHIDILFNNAGITADAQLVKMTEEQFDRVIAVNLKGVFNCAHAVAPHMIQHGFGRIINMSSIVAHNGNFGQTNYVATKAAVIGMTKTWARELGPKGIKVNAVAPGFTLTEMIKSVPEKILTSLSEKTPVRRLGEPGEIADAVLFLASEEASYINGTVICVDGGLTL
jgi:3-oxoacyl-[acyl-carrier protein] reductase